MDHTGLPHKAQKSDTSNACHCETSAKAGMNAWLSKHILTAINFSTHVATKGINL